MTQVSNDISSKVSTKSLSTKNKIQPQVMTNVDDSNAQKEKENSISLDSEDQLTYFEDEEKSIKKSNGGVSQSKSRARDSVFSEYYSEFGDFDPNDDNDDLISTKSPVSIKSRLSVVSSSKSIARMKGSNRNSLRVSNLNLKSDRKNKDTLDVTEPHSMRLKINKMVDIEDMVPELVEEEGWISAREASEEQNSTQEPIDPAESPKLKHNIEEEKATEEQNEKTRTDAGD